MMTTVMPFRTMVMLAVVIVIMRVKVVRCP